MKLFKKLVKRRNSKASDGSSPNRSANNSFDGRQNSTQSLPPPEFLGDGGWGEEDTDRASRSFTPYQRTNSTGGIAGGRGSFSLTEEERGQILADEMSISRPDDDPSFLPPQMGIPTTTQLYRTNSQSQQQQQGRSSTPSSLSTSPLPPSAAHQSTVPVASPVGRPSPSTSPAQPQPPRRSLSSQQQQQQQQENVQELYRAQSDYVKKPSFHNRSMQSLLSEGGGGESVGGGYPPFQLSPSEAMEVNRLMSLGYPYEAALEMIGINPNEDPSAFAPPPPYPPQAGLPPQTMMMLPPPPPVLPPYAGYPPMMPPPPEFYGAFPPPPLHPNMVQPHPSLTPPSFSPSSAFILSSLDANSSLPRLLWPSHPSSTSPFLPCPNSFLLFSRSSSSDCLLPGE